MYISEGAHAPEIKIGKLTVGLGFFKPPYDYKFITLIKKFKEPRFHDPLNQTNYEPIYSSIAIKCTYFAVYLLWLHGRSYNG